MKKVFSVGDNCVDPEFMIQGSSEQKKGRWIWDDMGYHCSECWSHGDADLILCGRFIYCPNCGAKMEVSE